MPKTKAAPKGGRKKKKAPSDALPLDPEDQVRHLQVQVDALQMQLAHKADLAAHASSSCESMKKEVIKARQRYAEETELSLGVTRDMTRQYKSMQEDLLNKIIERENNIQNLKDDSDQTAKSHEAAIREKKFAIRTKEAKIVALELRMEEICTECAHMMSSCRNKISEKIVDRSSENVVMSINSNLKKVNLLEEDSTG